MYSNVELGIGTTLHTAQLRLAFSALVRAVVPSSLIRLLRWTQTHSSYPTSASTHSYLLSKFPLPRLRRHHHQKTNKVAFIVSTSALPLPLLPCTLETIRSIILSLPDGHKRRELIEELFKEILERFGDGGEGGHYEVVVVRSGRSWLWALDVVIGREGKREALFRRGCNYFMVTTAPLYGLLHQVYSLILFQVHLAADYCYK
jgi:hypothetical protein